MNIHQRVNTLVGDFVGEVQVAQHVQDAIEQVLSELPREVLPDLYVDLTDSGSGVSVADYRVVQAHKAGYEATRYIGAVSAILDEEATDEKRPIYYVLGETLYIKPDGGTAIVVLRPTVTTAMIRGASVTGLTAHVERVVVIKAAIYALDAVMAAKHCNMPVTITMPTAPTEPEAPVINYEDAAAVAPSATAIDTLPTKPEYTPPVFLGDLVLPTIPAIDPTLDPDGGTITVPSPPDVPDITYVASKTTAISQTTISALATPPAYNYVLPTLDFTDWDQAHTDDDTELMQVLGQKIGIELQNLQATMGDEQAKFQSEVEEYRADTQHKIKQAELDQQRLVTAATQETDVDMRNAMNQAQIGIEAYVAELRGYDTEVRGYSERVNVVINAWQADFQRTFTAWQGQQALTVQFFRAESETTAVAYNGSMVEYKSGVDKVMSQAQIAMQEAMQTAKQSTEVDIVNKARKMESDLSEYQADLAKYSALLQAYLGKIDGFAKQIESEGGAMSNKLRMMQFDRNRIQEQYNDAVTALFGYYRSFRKNQSVFMHEF